MPKHVGYSAPYESRVQSRERWRKVHMKVRITRWRLLAITCATLLAAIAGWGWWERKPVWEYPVTVACAAWLYVAGIAGVSRLRAWRSYVATVIYFEAIEDGHCPDRRDQITRKNRDRWYRERGSPWSLQPVPESMRMRPDREDWPII
jgi:hypothetical protein